MDYKDLVEINFGNPSIELLQEYIDGNESSIAFYKECYKKDKRRYWLGKMGNRAKINKSLKRHIEEIKQANNGN